MPAPLLPLLKFGGYLPYLAERWPELAARLSTVTAKELLDEQESGWAKTPREDLNATAATLRKEKQHLALLLGYAELAGTIPVMEQTRALSQFAIYAVKKTLQACLDNAAALGQIAETALDNCGITIIGMGKLGADELNFSSDIDIIVFYDREKCAGYINKSDPGTFMVRLTRQLVSCLSDQTADGYVFRTDLRLRPDPASTPLAVSLAAAETYYSSIAATWERAAMIKAKPIAGDAAAAAEFSKLIQPFVWRRNLDFAALDEIHAIKTQINPQRRFQQAASGLNIKTGLGGIREIEFFAQTQQLIWGGRERRLRLCGTLEALDMLVECGRVASVTASALYEAYIFLRGLEHRLQLLHDAQTHTIPTNADDLQQIAASYGKTISELLETLDARRTLVAAAYGALFEDPTAAKQQDSLTLNSEDSNPLVIKELGELGYADPAAIAACLHKWHNHGYRVLMTPRAQSLLIEITPALLRAAAQTSSPDAAIFSFDGFLSKLNAGVQLFALLKANPELLQTLAEVLGEAPQIAERLALQPHLLDNFLITDPLEDFPTAQQLRLELNAALARAASTEDRLRNLAMWHRDWLFRLHMHIFRRTPQSLFASAYLTVLADAATTAALDSVKTDFISAHGDFPGGQCAVLALGKQGSGEMTVNSDLDVVFIYHVPDAHTLSTGAKALSPAVYYTRLCQRFVSVLSLPNPGSVTPLYQIDLRLRPEGNAGQAATSLSAFKAYYTTGSAQTWEYQALTRARAVAGDAALCAELEETCRAFLSRPRFDDALRDDVLSMLKRYQTAHPPRDAWHVKHIRGGMVDIEFAAQFLQLKYAAAHPLILQKSTRASLLAVSKLNVEESEPARILADIYPLYMDIQNLTRLTVGSVKISKRASFGLKKKLAHVLEAVDFEAAEVHIIDVAAIASAAISKIFIINEDT
jgi:glutamate-ammonia-ligase adenylyltransferase